MGISPAGLCISNPSAAPSEAVDRRALIDLNPGEYGLFWVAGLDGTEWEGPGYDVVMRSRTDDEPRPMSSWYVVEISARDSEAVATDVRASRSLRGTWRPVL